MQFNEFQRRLEKAHLSHDAMYLLSHMFEVQTEFSKAIDQMVSMMDQLVNRLQDVVNINTETLRQMTELKRRGMMDGVSVRSEPYEKD